jgi:hypothetical protein
MSGGSGGGGSGGREGGGGNPKYGPGTSYPLGGSQPLPGDTKFTAAIRAEYGDGRKGVNVSTEQLRGGTTRMTHATGTITINENGASVQGSYGKRYSYSEKNLVKAMEHWEKLGGIKP